ncbi:synaptopodin-2-like isoform X2 [Hoplias malabaricus]|uniref:synaptopodin-2-like isoform X2 n=1 Tax=Hoplias malabaricus TaxID=27720 RepID=UPI0034635C3A
MGAGDQVWISDWGFGLQHSGSQPNCTLRVDQVKEGSNVSLAGLREDDEIVSINGETCSGLSLSEAVELIKSATDGLQLLVKRCCFQGGFQAVSTTLTIPPPQRPQAPKELYISESQDEAFYGETDIEAESPGRTPMVRTQFCIPPKDRFGANTQISESGGTELEITPGSVVELQLSLSQATLQETGCTSLGCARGVEKEFYHTKNKEDEDNTATVRVPGCTIYVPLHEREPLRQRGVLISAASARRSSGSERVGSSETEAQASERVDYGEGEGGHSEEFPTSSSVSFGIPSEEGDSESERELNKPNKHRAKHARLRRSESLSEKQVKEAKSKCKRIALLLTAATPNPNNKGVLMFKKHRQRAKQYTLVSYGTGEDEPDFEDEGEDQDDDKRTHTVEFTVLATSETELDEDFFTNPPGHKSIATFDWDTGLLEIERKLHNPDDMSALPETKGKGALMFAQRRQRIDEIAAEHEEMRSKGIPVEGVQEAEKQYQQVEQSPYVQATDSQNYMDVNVHHQQQQQQQYQQYQEQYYQQQQYQEYQQQLQYQQQQQHYQKQQQQEQQHYQQQELQQQHYQQQQELQQQHYQQQQEYQHQHYQQQQEYQQQQQYNQTQQYQQQPQVQQYLHHMNDVSSQQSNVMQSSVMNRCAKPFSIQNTPESQFSPSTGEEQPCYSVGQGEQIASRDERISVPAIKTGILQDTKRKNKVKPMFTFKESPKVSPNPMLLNLLNKSDKKAGFESGPEEDYLSLGAEACNFLQPTDIKHKIPPPVAPKPHINPVSPPWSPQPELTSQQFPQHAENNIQATAEAPGPEAEPAPEMESSVMPEQRPPPTPAPELQEAPTETPSQEQQVEVGVWSQSEQQMQPDQQQETWNENQPQQLNNSQPVQSSPQVHAKSELHVSFWGQSPSPTQQQQPPVSTWGTAEVQPQTLAQTQTHLQPWVTQPQVQMQPATAFQTQSQPQPPWVTQSPPQPQPQAQPQPQPQAQPQPQSQAQLQAPQMNSWATAATQSPAQPQWGPSQMQAQSSASMWSPDINQAQVQPAWAQQQQKSQPLPPWAAPQPHSQPPWAQAQSQPQSQPPWGSQAQQQPLPQQPWTHPQSPVQAQPPWVQPPSQPPAQIQQSQNAWASVPTQPQQQQPWAQQPQEHSQQMMNSWAPDQNQVQPQWSQPQPPALAQPPWVHQTQQEAPPTPLSQSKTVTNAWEPRAQQVSSTTTPPAESQKQKPWSPPQTTQPPLQRMGSYTFGTKAPSPTPPSSTMSPSGMGSAFEMPALRGKGAELFAKRQSRMEKYVVDSDTVQANKALGRRSSLSPPVRLSPMGLSSRSASVSPLPRPSSHTRYSFRSTERPVVWSEKVRKPPTPWEAASRHPFGLVDEAFVFQELQHSIAANLRSAAHRKLLPEPPADWKARVAYEPPSRNLGWTTTRTTLPFLSPTKSTASAPAVPVPYTSTLRPSLRPPRSMTEANLSAHLARPENKRVVGQSSMKSAYSYTWKR